MSRLGSQRGAEVACRLALGVDIGGTKILTALVDEQATVLASWRTPTPAAAGGAAVLKSVEDAIAGALAELAPEQRERLVGIGISAAGQVDADVGAIAYASPNIPGWTGTRVREALSPRFELPVIVDNDANAAAYGEWWAGGGKALDSMVMITVGTGIGGGIVLNGRVLRGGRWRGGEIGHMVIDADGVRCNCGQRGCLEMYASGTAIGRMAREARPGWTPSGPEVFAAAAAGDAVAQGVLERAASYLAAGIVSLSSVLDPDGFLLGGGVSEQPAFLPLVRAALARDEVSGARGFDGQCVQLATLGAEAGAVGAAGLVLAGSSEPRP